MNSPGPLISSPPSDTEFRKFASCFPTGIIVVTTKGVNGELCGTTMNSVTCLSVNPPTYLMCFDRRSRTLAALLRSKVFCINILAADQQEVSKAFASKASDKFERVGFSFSSSGVPILNGTAAACEGRVSGECDGGDHAIVLGRISRVHFGQRDPLVYERGKFRTLADQVVDFNRVAIPGVQ